MKAKLAQRCLKCSCELTLEDGDTIKPKVEGINILYFVTCPVCDNEVFLYKKTEKR